MRGRVQIKESRTNVRTRIMVVIISIYLIFPLLLTFIYSLSRQWNDVLPQGFTLEYYGKVILDIGFWIPLLRTIGISLLPVGLSVVLVVLAVYSTSIAMPQYEKYMQILCTIPYALQGIILAISILSLYAGAPFPFSNRLFMLVGTYCVVVLPHVYRGIRNGLYAINAKQLIEAAQIMGMSSFRAYIVIVVPNIVKGIKVSILLATALLFGDFVIVNIIGGSYFQTAQMYLYKQLFQSGQVSSAIIIILFIVTLLLSGSVFLFSRKSHSVR